MSAFLSAHSCAMCPAVCFTDTLVNLNLNLNVMQEKLSDEMFGHFASATQMASREAQWPRFNAKADNVMTFVLPEAKVVSNRFADAHHYAFWELDCLLSGRQRTFPGRAYHHEGRTADTAELICFEILILGKTTHE